MKYFANKYYFIFLLSFIFVAAAYLCKNLFFGKHEASPEQQVSEVKDDWQEIDGSQKRLSYTSLTKEVAIESLPVTGIIPTWLSGTLFRNGPAQFELNDTPFNHLFDGFAMVHRFRFTGNGVSYANKFLETSYRSKAIKKGKLSFGFDEAKEGSSWFTAMTKLLSKPPVYDNTNVSIARYGKAFVALTETPHAIAFDPQTLKTLGAFVYEDKLEAPIGTAHPLVDPETKELFNLLIQYGKTSYYQLYKMQNGNAQRTLIASIATKQPSYIHSFALTKQYVILLLPPLVINPLDLIFSNKSFIDNFSWQPERGTQILVIDRNTGKRVGTYTTEPLFFYHIANSYEKNNQIIIDLTTYSHHGVIYGTKLKNLRSKQHCLYRSKFRRLAIDTEAGAIKIKSVFEDGIELPRINDRYAGKEYSFVYGVDDFEQQLIKFDLSTGATKIWQQKNCFVGEPVFVQKPGANKEDHGALLATVLDSARGNSFLLILDATTMKECARAQLPHHIPFGFHGNFYG